MAAVLKLETAREQKEAENWRQAGYRAVEDMVDKLKDQIQGKSFEELSELLRREGQGLTGATAARSHQKPRS